MRASSPPPRSTAGKDLARFGWAYIWVVGIPILLCAFLLRYAFGFGWWVRARVAKRRIERGKPVWGVAILVVLSVVVLPILLSADGCWRCCYLQDGEKVFCDGVCREEDTLVMWSE